MDFHDARGVPLQYDVNRGDAEFSGYTTPQTVILVVAAIAAAALTILAAVFIGAAAIAVAAVGVIGFTVLALQFRANVIGYETYHLHNPGRPRNAFNFWASDDVVNWNSNHRPLVLGVRWNKLTAGAGVPARQRVGNPYEPNRYANPFNDRRDQGRTRDDHTVVGVRRR
jgi:hypothetical protein